MPVGPASYRIVILTADRMSEVAGLMDGLQQNAMAAGNSRAVLLIEADPFVLSGRSEPTQPPTVLVVISGGARTANDPAVAAAIAWSQRHFIPVLPVVSNIRTAQQQIPPALMTVNALQWIPGESAAHLTNVILRLVGLAEEDRRIFLSHRRSDGTALAEQLRLRLADDRWDVFLDRFSVPPAVDFQARLDRELADKAFVLLLETPEAAASPWVEHEIAFALRHRLGLMSLTSPTTSQAQLFPAISDFWRHRLHSSDFAVASSGESVLSEAALDKVLDAIEVQYSSTVRLRRESVMTDASAELHTEGYVVTTVGEWGLLARLGPNQEVLLVTHRAPMPADLREAESLRRRLRRSNTRTRGWVVHPTEDIDRDRASLLRWLSSRRSVRPTPLMLLRERITP